MPKRARLTAEEKAEILRLRIEDRLSIPEIARAMGSNNATVHEIVQPYPLTPEEQRTRRQKHVAIMRAGLQRRGNYIGGEAWTEQEDAAIRKVWPARSAAAVIAALPGRSWAAIGKHAAELGVRRSRAASNKRSSQRRIDKFFLSLREVREARGITREELAERMGIHLVMLAHYELGEARPGWLRIRDWLAALGYEIQLVPKDATERSRGKRTWLPEEEQNMRELLSQGSTIAEISLALKRPALEIEKTLQMLGLSESERERNASGMMKARLS